MNKFQIHITGFSDNCLSYWMIGIFLYTGRATKLIIPSDIQGIAGLAASIKEIVTDDPNAPKQSETPNA